MMIGNLSPLQIEILQVLAEIKPPWTLTGGAALVGFHLKHRLTKDLDLFWHQQDKLDTLPSFVTSLLQQKGWDVEILQTSAAFCRIRVCNDAEVVLVDLVAEPVASLEEVELVSIGPSKIRIDSYYEILVNKFCALLSRSELRDLQDAYELLKRSDGYTLEHILKDAAKKDAGFSPLVLAWTLRDFPIAAIAKSMSWSEEQILELSTFRDTLIQQLLASSQPE